MFDTDLGATYQLYVMRTTMLHALHNAAAANAPARAHVRAAVAVAAAVVAAAVVVAAVVVAAHGGASRA
jgi:hypothetical protein